MAFEKIIAMVMVVIVMLGVGIPTFMAVITPITEPNYVASETIGSAGSFLNNTLVNVAYRPIDYSEGEPVVSNGTTTLTKGSNYTLYTLNSANSTYNGTIAFTNVAEAYGNTSLVSYYYQQQGYSDNELVKLILQLLPLAFAVVALIMIFMMMG
jgi:hypothetical protein